MVIKISVVLLIIVYLRAVNNATVSTLDTVDHSKRDAALDLTLNLSTFIEESINGNYSSDASFQKVKEATGFELIIIAVFCSAMMIAMGVLYAHQLGFLKIFFNKFLACLVQWRNAYNFLMQQHCKMTITNIL